MPTYQYRCEKCGAVFERVERMSEHAAAHKCPQCGSENVHSAPTPFIAKTSRKS